MIRKINKVNDAGNIVKKESNYSTILQTNLEKDTEKTKGNLAISFTSKNKLNTMINKTNSKVIKMKEEIASVTKTMKIATNKSTEAAICNVASYILSHNNNIQTMEEVFAENIDMMDALKNYFDIKLMITSAIKDNISS